MMPLKDNEARAAYHKQYMKEWYAKNSKQHQVYVSKRNKKYQYELDALKMHPCMDCGFVPQIPQQMDWDHISGIKIDNVSNLRKLCVGRERMLEEMAKCELVCSNCHRFRTWTRQQGARAAIIEESTRRGGEVPI
jgi:hypothetical protein